ncbi:hypothetical protein QR680_003123 [Steinernema hermaphroditum]|uniref:Uncharacterized protein n=1 Tax=Steinernema hermaphroditum TaxID=289476 RepID=A0AA39LJP1_9BILA|nr:hypothetical protein QR680_003123 [Steinernema hermaphroditum]
MYFLSRSTHIPTQQAELRWRHVQRYWSRRSSKKCAATCVKLILNITITRPEPARDGMEDTDMDVLKITAPKELTEEEHARNLHQNGGSMSETFVCLADKKDK